MDKYVHKRASLLISRLLIFLESRHVEALSGRPITLLGVEIVQAVQDGVALLQRQSHVAVRFRTTPWIMRINSLHKCHMIIQNHWNIEGLTRRQFDPEHDHENSYCVYPVPIHL